MTNRTVTATLRAQVAGFVNNIRSAHEQYRKFSDDLVDNHKKRQALSDLSNVALGVGTALTGAFVYAIKVGADFDKQMSAVAAATGATAGELDKLRAAALAAGESTAYSAREAAQAEEELAKAGLSTAEILSGGLAGALNLAAAGGIEVADAAEIAATALKQFGLSGSDIPHVADLLASGANNAQGGVKELGDALGQSGLVASQFGLSIEETIGSLTAFASAGLLGSDAGTSLKTMLLRLAAPSGEATALMNKLGISAYDAQGQFVGMTAFAGQLENGLSKMSQKQRDAAMATIFGSDAIRAANVLFKEGADGVSGWEEAVDQAGAAAETARKRTDNLAGDIERLGGTIETALITGSSGSTEVLRGLTQSVDGAIKGFTALPDPVEGAITALVGIGGIIALAVGGLGRMVVSTAETRQALNDLEMTGTRTQKGMAKMTKVVGRAAIVIGAMQVASAAFASSPNVALDKLIKDLDKFADSGKASGQAARILGKDLEYLNYDVQAVGAEGLQKTGAQFLQMIESITGAGQVFDFTVTKANERIQTLDQSLAAMVQGGNADGAEDAFARIKAAAKEQGVSIDALKEKFPMYEAALESTLTTHEALTQSLDDTLLSGHSFVELLGLLHGAAIKWAEAEIAAEESLDGFKAALDASNGSMDVHTAQGRKAKASMIGLINSAAEAADAKMEESGNTYLAIQTYYKYIDSLKKTMRQAGMTEAEIDDLISKYAEMPKSLTTNVYTVYHTKGDYQSFKQAQAEAASKLYNADGAIYNADGNVLSFAGGGEHHLAQIARPGDMRVWAEPETGGEAYIPFAESKRGRSMAIWRETGRRLGAMDSSVSTRDIVNALESAGGRGPVTIQMSAWTDRFNYSQVERELAMHGVV